MDVFAFLESLPDPVTRLIQIAAVIVIAILARIILVFVIRRVVNRVVSGVKKRHKVDDTRELEASPLAAVRLVQRTRSLGSVLSNGATALIVGVAILLIFTIAVPDATAAFALITAAVGAGLGFGAQNIVRDVLNGIFIVAEDQLGIGDVVDLGLATGVVEDVGIRITQVRDVNGTLWFVRNGEILRLGNMSYGWARAIIDLAVPYDSDVEAIEARILDVATELADDPKWKHRILEKPALWGIESISAEAIVVRLVVKTRSTAKDDVARELRWRLKKALDEMGIRLPALNSIILTGFEGASGLRSSKAARQKPRPSLDEVAKKNRAPKGEA
ncbi:small-conductance mechanosensitive channel [Microbacteriaceae bacterium SG_E_30_P1]|uniref:Small-conductance mechanosensitive channel n=1 Tax=Antiquaquibacter oligotrophicus TaxID=2880260 RepID=A0ABT6KMP0_9MICO|nr:mechanosensitive ion channel domain-containing protein [Antiquaquibacter oligotrophicus]MDH6181275.1 small-conductance mechanosensitive channel [Antiquaquibacter oligotrophicus]UDF13030.1 mechanosensitive ion channel family protein [Antiquaquibacter oligotrophicus]